MTEALLTLAFYLMIAVPSAFIIAKPIGIENRYP